MKAGNKTITSRYARLKVIGLLIIIICIFLSGQDAESQDTPSQFKPELKRACSKDPTITFTEDQAVRMAALQREYSAEFRPLISELMASRMEFRCASENQEIQSPTLLEIQRKISALQAKLQDIAVLYQIKFRSLFTKDQWERLPPDCPLKLKSGYGTSKKSQRGVRW